jgi:hypothetical protein
VFHGVILKLVLAGKTINMLLSDNFILLGKNKTLQV